MFGEGIGAQTPAFIDWLADGCLLTFTEEKAPLPGAAFSPEPGLFSCVCRYSNLVILTHFCQIWV
jgi:hypothetical protein